MIKRPGGPDIVVHKHFRDSLDSYEEILQMVKEIWDAKRSSFFPKPDQNQVNEDVDIAFCLHLGMTTRVPEFRAEKIAYRDGYWRAGEDGVEVDKEHFKKLGLPESLKPGFNVDAAIAKVKQAYPVRSHIRSGLASCL